MIRKQDYPPDWPTISKQVRDEAHQCCEWCQVPNRAIIERGPNGKTWTLVPRTGRHRHPHMGEVKISRSHEDCAHRSAPRSQQPQQRPAKPRRPLPTLSSGPRHPPTHRQPPLRSLPHQRAAVATFHRAKPGRVEANTKLANWGMNAVQGLRRMGGHAGLVEF